MIISNWFKKSRPKALLYTICGIIDIETLSICPLCLFKEIGSSKEHGSSEEIGSSKELSSYEEIVGYTNFRPRFPLDPMWSWLGFYVIYKLLIVNYDIIPFVTLTISSLIIISGVFSKLSAIVDMKNSSIHSIHDEKNETK
ncbi:hypothetical protein C1646_751566 [Rhizophagus diaphanus]|nr:hypothetical protein C1646_751566 [Rhizophagus diaphanus] [Rhizophagus sp. MUCL 43196]